MKKRMIIGLLILGLLGGSMTLGTKKVQAANPWDGTSTLDFSLAPGETGTASNPYLLDSPEELYYLSLQVQGGNTYAGTYFSLGDDLNLGNQEWESIGTEAAPFGGVVMGDNRKITGLSIENANAEKGCGLFGYLASGGEIRDLTVEGEISFTGGKDYVALLCGANQGTISHCTSMGSVQVNRNYVGGLVGSNYGGLVEDCENLAAVTQENSSAMVFNYGGIAGGSTGTILSSVNRGNVTGNYGGGIVGFNNGQVSFCYNTGSIGGVDAGALSGYNGGTMDHCYNRGTSTGSPYMAYSYTTDGGVCLHAYRKPTQCYYLETTVSNPDPETKGTTKMTAAQLKAKWMLPLLNDSGDPFVEDVPGKNDGYPILSWEMSGVGTTTYTVGDLSGFINFVSTQKNRVAMGTSAAAFPVGSYFAAPGDHGDLEGAITGAMQTEQTPGLTGAAIAGEIKTLGTFWQNFLETIQPGTGSIGGSTSSIDSTIFVYGDTLHAGTHHSGSYPTWIAKNYSITQGQTALEVLTDILNQEGYTYRLISSSYGQYLSSVTTPQGITLGEGTNGSPSGWLYKVNGQSPSVSLDSYVLSNGDTILLYYVDDWQRDWTEGGFSGGGTLPEEELGSYQVVPVEQGVKIEFKDKTPLTTDIPVTIPLVSEGFTPGQRVFLYRQDEKGNFLTIAYGYSQTLTASGELVLPLTHRGDLWIRKEKAEEFISLRKRITAPTSITLKVGEEKKVTLSLPVSLELVTSSMTGSGRKMTAPVYAAYESLHPNVVTVSKEGVLKGKKRGTATLRIKVTLYSGKTKVLTSKIKIK